MLYVVGTYYYERIKEYVIVLYQNKSGSQRLSKF